MSEHVAHLAMNMMDGLNETFDGEAEVEIGMVIVAFRLPDGNSGTAYQTTEGTDWKMLGLLDSIRHRITAAMNTDASDS